jgi:hypothetical protein
MKRSISVPLSSSPEMRNDVAIKKKSRIDATGKVVFPIGREKRCRICGRGHGTKECGMRNAVNGGWRLHLVKCFVGKDGGGWTKRTEHQS